MGFFKELGNAFGSGLKGFGGGGDEVQQLQLYTPQQQDFMSMILGGATPGMESGLSYLSQMLSGDEEAFSAFEDPYKRQFQEQTIPGLAERFASLDAQGSSAFGQALGGAGAGLSENLASLREGLKMQSISQLQGLSGLGLKQQFENLYKQDSGGSGADIAKIAMQLAMM